MNFKKINLLILFFLSLFLFHGNSKNNIETVFENSLNNFLNNVDFGEYYNDDGKIEVKIGKILFNHEEIQIPFNKTLKYYCSKVINNNDNFLEITNKYKSQDNKNIFKFNYSKISLNIDYFKIEKNIYEINIKLYDIDKSTILSSYARQIEIESIRNYNFDEILNFHNMMKDIKNPFNIQVTTNKNDSPYYVNGEKLKIFIRSDINCYIKIFHIDVNGNIKIIFPNIYSVNNEIYANKTNEFPNKQMNFDFILTEPYGIEYLFVLASNTQFLDVKKIIQSNSFFNLGNIHETDISSNGARGLSIEPTTQTSGNYTSYTISRRQN